MPVNACGNRSKHSAYYFFFKYGSFLHNALEIAQKRVYKYIYSSYQDTVKLEKRKEKKSAIVTQNKNLLKGTPYKQAELK